MVSFARVGRWSVWRRSAVGLLAISAVGCAGNDASPSQSVASIAVQVPTDLFVAGTRATLGAVAILSGGSTVSPTGVIWTSDDPTIAAVDASGILEAEKSGVTTIRVSADGLTASTAIRVVPRLQGIWTGSAMWRGCKNVTGHARIWLCSHTTAANIGLSLTQNRDVVQGTVSVGGSTAPVSGSVDVGGILTLTGGSVTAQNATSALANWTSAVSGSLMTGSFTTHSVATDGSPDSADNDWELSSVIGPN
jgi:hypothetical protein